MLLLCITGFLIYWILSIQSRTLQFGIFRAMGMSMGEILTMLVNEQLFITGVSIAAGPFLIPFAEIIFSMERLSSICQSSPYASPLPASAPGIS